MWVWGAFFVCLGVAEGGGGVAYNSPRKKIHTLFLKGSVAEHQSTTLGKPACGSSREKPFLLNIVRWKVGVRALEVLCHFKTQIRQKGRCGPALTNGHFKSQASRAGDSNLLPDTEEATSPRGVAPPGKPQR